MERLFGPQEKLFRLVLLPHCDGNRSTSDPIGRSVFSKFHNLGHLSSAHLIEQQRATFPNQVWSGHERFFG